MAKVSIVVNCFNSEEYLKEALESIKSQTFTDYEVIFIDNCSTDNSAKIANDFGEKLKYYKTDYTLPLGAGRNYAIERCKGEYIAFLDCDDLWEHNKLEIQVDIMDSNPNCCLTMSNIYMLNMIDGTKKITISEKNRCRCDLESFAIDYKYGMSSFLLRNSTINKFELKFDERLSYAEEYDFFLRLSCYGEVIYTPEVLSTYRVHKEMNSKKLKETIPGEYDIVLNNLKRCKEGIVEEHPNVFVYLEFLRDYTQAKIFIENKENKNARTVIKPHIWKFKKAFIFYAISFMPKNMTYLFYTKYYKHKVV